MIGRKSVKIFGSAGIRREAPQDVAGVPKGYFVIALPSASTICQANRTAGATFPLKTGEPG